MKYNAHMRSMNEILPKTIKSTLTDLIQRSKKVLILGIGEVNMKDDGFGPYITVYFTKKESKKALFINAGTTPEERKQEMINFNPDLLLLIDTCSSGDPPGTVILADENQLINFLPISSHTLPIQVFIQVLKESLENLQVFLLGVNPFSLEAAIERFYYKPEVLDLEDYENDPNLPFFEINLTSQVKSIADEIIDFMEHLLFK